MTPQAPFPMLQKFVDSVRKSVLPNGLTLLAREQAGSGVVAIVTWVRAGYFHEPDEVAGMAHLFEHMFFKGSRHYPGPEEIATHVSALGGSTNAGTIYDSTSYHFVLPREAFERGMEIQADAILAPLFDPEELRKEAEVVIEESNRKRDDPSAFATEKMYEVAFTRHRMRRWRIGSDEVLRNLRRDALVAFFETLYRPSNIIVAVAGDVSPDLVHDVALRTFGAIPPGVVSKEAGPAEPPQREFRFGQSAGDLTQAVSVFGWHTPPAGSDEEEPLDLLAFILGGGRSSRLYREVIRGLGASSLTAWNSTFEDVGMFTVRSTFDDPKLSEVEGRIAREVERMKRFGPTEFEVRLARNRIESDVVFSTEDVLGQAEALAYHESRGGYGRLSRYLARLAGATPARIREVANRLLTFENLSLFRHRPASAPPSEAPLVLSALAAASTGILDRPVEDAVPPPGSPPASTSVNRPLQRFVLSNGMTLFVLERAGTPTVAADLWFKGGRIHECSANAGITQLMARLMRRGSRRRSGDDIDRTIEFLGTSFGVTVRDDYFGFGVDILRDRLPAALDLLAEFVLQPTFPVEKLQEERELQLASIRRSFDSSSERSLQLLHEAYFGTHPYAFPSSGFETSVAALEREQIVGWWRESVVADSALLVIVGDVRADEIAAKAEDLFGELPKSRRLRAGARPFRPPRSARQLTESRRRKQAAIAAGFPIVPPQHPDWTVLRVIQDVASGLAGTFVVELRGRRSLAYTVWARDSSSELAGFFVGYIACEWSKEQEALGGLLAEFRRLGEEGITASDLERAKAYLAGSTRIRLQTNAALAADVANAYLLGLGTDFRERFLERVRGVTLDQARTVAKRYFSEENTTVAIVRGGEGT